MKFNELTTIKKSILKSLDEMGIFDMTPIQEKAIPRALESKNIIAQAQTGTGKTIAFGVPIINSIDENSNSFEHLIITPTRELATQVFQEFRNLSKYTNTKIALILGGISYEKQGKILNEKPHIIIATPGRLNDHLINKRIKLNKLKSFTLDEVDELLNIGFQKEIESIISFLPEVRQNYFFTATFDNKTKKLSQMIIKNNFENIQISSGLKTIETIKQEYILVKEKNKLATLIKLLEFYNPQSVIIFGRTKKRVDELCDALNMLNYNAVAIQGNMEQKDRFNVIQKFKSLQKNILVATDVVARGIDISHVEWVVNFDLPQEIEYYTHRIGRVGRAGREGYSISFVKYDEIEHLKEIEKQTNSFIKETFLPSDEETFQVWRNRVNDKLEKILENSINNEENPTYLEEYLVNKFSQNELAILLADFLLQNRRSNKKIILSPEPSVTLKGSAKARSIRNKLKQYNVLDKKNIRNRNYAKSKKK